MSNWFKEFCEDETDYYGDIKATTIFLMSQLFLVAGVILVYYFNGAL